MTSHSRKTLAVHEVVINEYSLLQFCYNIHLHLIQIYWEVQCCIQRYDFYWIKDAIVLSDILPFSPLFISLPNPSCI